MEDQDELEAEIDVSVSYVPDTVDEWRRQWCVEFAYRVTPDEKKLLPLADKVCEYLKTGEVKQPRGA